MWENSAFCVFRKGKIWLAFPAKSIREVLPCPGLVSVPRSHRILSGLSHIRSEFIPVLNLSSLLPDEQEESEPILIIIEDSSGDWGLLVDEVDSLVSLEPSNASEESLHGWESAVVGWATSNDRVIRVLDHIRFRELATQELAPEVKTAETDLLDESLTSERESPQSVLT